MFYNKNCMMYRNEWKYTCRQSDLLKIENRINNILYLDTHIDKNKGFYEIHSIYFDDYKNSCANDNDAGVSRRYKWRIRYYDNDLSTLTLEKKIKYNGMCYKKQCKIDLETYNNIINRDIDKIIWGNNQDKVLISFCKDILSKLYVPKVIVDYERRAFVEEFNNVRITFDRNISVSKDIDKFLTRDYSSIPLLDNGQHVLEVKFDYMLPSYINKLVDIDELIQNSFSKYYLGSRKLGRTFIWISFQKLLN